MPILERAVDMLCLVHNCSNYQLLAYLVQTRTQSEHEDVILPTHYQCWRSMCRVHECNVHSGHNVMTCANRVGNGYTNIYNVYKCKHASMHARTNEESLPSKATQQQEIRWTGIEAYHKSVAHPQCQSKRPAIMHSEQQTVGGPPTKLHLTTAWLHPIVMQLRRQHCRWSYIMQVVPLPHLQRQVLRPLNETYLRSVSNYKYNC